MIFYLSAIFRELRKFRKFFQNIIWYADHLFQKIIAGKQQLSFLFSLQTSYILTQSEE